jgi:hypothetical protein
MKTELVEIIGIDCATDDSKIGVALGIVDGSQVDLLEVMACSRSRTASSAISEWLSRTGPRRVLIAIDAPLGWPAPLAASLADHVAGGSLAPTANELFRRTTDVFIKEKLGQTSLDVGADRIARTAHSALRLLTSVRVQSRLPLQLAWSPADAATPSVIEVYPAATLVAHRIRSKGYKKPAQAAERSEIIAALSARMNLPDSAQALLNNPDCLDAAVCVLAGVDFLAGRAMAPQDLSLAKREGWIWAAGREG